MARTIGRLQASVRGLLAVVDGTPTISNDPASTAEISNPTWPLRDYG